MRLRPFESKLSLSHLGARFRFYKKGCQEKKISRELEAAKSFDIQPLFPCAGASRRNSACVVSPVKGEMFRCRVIQFPNSPFPLMRKGFFRTARSGQGRAASARRSEPLTARTVLRRFTKRERRGAARSISEAQQAKPVAWDVATIVLSETHGL